MECGRPAERDAGEGAQVEGRKKGLEVGPAAAGRQRHKADLVLFENTGSSCSGGSTKCKRTALARWDPKLVPLALVLEQNPRETLFTQ